MPKIPIAITAITSFIAIAVLVAVSAFLPWGDWIPRNSRTVKVSKDLRAICAAANTFRDRFGRWPLSIRELMDPPESDPPGPFCIAEPRDPWGNTYSLTIVDGNAVATCFGRDKRPGGSGEDADVVYTCFHIHP